MISKKRTLNTLLIASLLVFNSCKNSSYEWSSLLDKILNQEIETDQAAQKNKELFRASQEGDLKGIEKALKNGADINAVNYDGSSALMIAKTKASAEFLLSQGAEIELINKGGETALILHSRNNKIEIIKLLLEKGADINKKTLSGRTALMEAASNRSKEAVDLLTAQGADVNAVSKFGDTALLIAILNNNLNSAKKLLALGANPDIKNQAGWTAKTASKYFKQTNLIKIAEKKRARPSPSNCQFVFK